MVLAVSTPRSGDPLMPGLRIGPYLLLVPLGSGGSGRVWAVARTGQLGFSKRMALKVMRQDKLASERARQRFDREARLGAQLRHANLRAVHELGSHEDRPHMALAWVDTSLEELIEHAPGKRLEPDVVCWFGMQACAALAAAQAHLNPAGEPCPIVHGDVSPGNILLTLNGHVLLADLAAAADPSPSAPAEQRSSKAFFGSLGYAAPEALRGASVDGRADLFSLGCVLYEALCGAPAFEADDERSLLFQVLERGPVQLATRCPELAAELTSVVHRALERKLEQRFASAEEMRRALCACVPALTSFALEQRCTALIGRVLGERIRQREEEMRATYQRFAPSQLERTDTLPIGNGARRRDSTTLRTSLPDAPPTQRDASVSEPGSVTAPAEPKRKRRAFWLLLATIPAAAGSYLAWPQQHGQPAAGSTSSTSLAVPATADSERSDLSRQLQGLKPAPVASSSPPLPSSNALPDEQPAEQRSEPAPVGNGGSPMAVGSTAAPLSKNPGRAAPDARAARSASARTRGPPRSRYRFHPTKNPYTDDSKSKPSSLKSAPTR